MIRIADNDKSNKNLDGLVENSQGPLSPGERESYYRNLPPFRERYPGGSQITLTYDLAEANRVNSEGGMVIYIADLPDDQRRQLRRSGIRVMTQEEYNSNIVRPIAEIPKVPEPRIVHEDYVNPPFALSDEGFMQYLDDLYKTDED